MSQFYSKLKQGVSDAGKKAQQTVETATLKLQITSKEKEIEKLLIEIGRTVHKSFAERPGVIPLSKIERQRQSILRLEAEVEAIQRKLQQVQHKKECGCGKMLPMDASYCPFCGEQFQRIMINPTNAESTRCASCGTDSSIKDRYCRSCGHSLQT